MFHVTLKVALMGFTCDQVKPAVSVAVTAWLDRVRVKPTDSYYGAVTGRLSNDTQDGHSPMPTLGIFCGSLEGTPEDVLAAINGLAADIIKSAGGPSHHDYEVETRLGGEVSRREGRLATNRFPNAA